MKQLRKDCITYARLLGDYQHISCNDLADGYCKAIDEEDEANKNKYLAALILRFWYAIDSQFYSKNIGLKLDRQDYFMWLQESINYACKYRAWQDPNKKVNAQQAINRCIHTIRLQHYYNYNLDKSRANFNTFSLDNSVDSDGDGDETGTPTIDSISSGTDLLKESTSGARSLVQTYINEKKIVEAIIIDAIAYGDALKRERVKVTGIDEDGDECKYYENKIEFWPYQLVQILGNLPDDYEAYFTHKYSVKTNELEVAIKAIRDAKNYKRYKYLNNCLSDLRGRISLV